MIEHRMTHDIRATCDHCGIAASEWSGMTTLEANELAVTGSGFVLTQWQDNGCYRESLLCGPCYKKAMAKTK